MYAMASLDDVDEHELEDLAPAVRPVGYELRPSEMRPNVWEFDAGEKNNFHRQTEQEELYVVLEGQVDLTVEREDERDVVELRARDFAVVPPETWRQLEARERSTVLVVGAPNVKDDAVVESDAAG